MYYLICKNTFPHIHVVISQKTIPEQYVVEVERSQ